tara:strand:+ start:3524 stop:5290 length:1767 start_codon:yes stop_codon:yes gene_type:complete
VLKFKLRTLFLSSLFLISLSTFSYVINSFKSIIIYNPKKDNFNHLNFSYEIYSSENILISKKSKKFDITDPNEQIPILLKNVFISSEDKRFLNHNGIDLKGISRALFTNIRNGYIKEGGSTITQQVARLIFLNNELTLLRKLKELIIALIFEFRFSKNEILKIYLNNLYLGEGAYGINEAAAIYFGKLISELSLSEIALLAGLAPAPSIYNPYKNFDLSIKNRDNILNSMYLKGYISKKSLNSALNYEIKIKDKNLKKLNDRVLEFYIIDNAKNILKNKNKSELGKFLKIRSSINYLWQIEAQNITTNLPPQIEIALISIESSSGLIRTMISGREPHKNEFNRATNALRALGSTFKIIPYTAILLEGAELYDVYEDSPQCWNDYCPRNFADRYRNKISLIEAFKTSSNIVPIQISQELGLDKIINLANKFGLGSQQKLEKYLPIAIGAVGDNLLNITNTYSIINNNGVSIKPSIISQIENQDSRVIWSNNIKGVRIIDDKIVRKLNQMLEKSVSEGNGIAASIEKEKILGKTGTSDKNRDLWFIGSIKDTTTGIWIGYDDNRVTQLSSGNAANLWKVYIKKIIDKNKN